MNQNQAAKTSMFGPAMQNVTSGALSIQDIIPYRTGEDKTVGNGGITLQMIDEDGAGVDVYAYYEAEELGEGVPAGWYWDNGSFESPDPYTFDFGEGMVLTVDENWTDVQFKLAGQVDMSTTQFAVPAKASILANSRPKALSIQGLVPSRTGEDKAVGNGGITLQLIDEDGAGIDVYAYYEAEELGEGIPAGWYWDNGSFETPDAYTIEIGEGLVLTVDENWTDVIFTVPAL